MARAALGGVMWTLAGAACGAGAEGEAPPLDVLQRRAVAERLELCGAAQPADGRYPDQPVPRRVHRLAAEVSGDGDGGGAAGGRPAAACDDAWRQWSAALGYQFRLWTPADGEVVAAMMPGTHRALFAADCAAGGPWSARCRELVGTTVLRQEGGVLAAEEVWPPRAAAGFVDLAALMPMRGLTLLPRGRGDRQASWPMDLWAAPSLVVASPRHPDLFRLEDGLVAAAGRAGQPAGGDARGSDDLRGRGSGVLGVFSRISAAELGMVVADGGAVGGGMPPVSPAGALAPAAVFDADIPRRIHQIWFGDMARCPQVPPRLWRRYAEVFGYHYRFWSEADLVAIQAFMPATNYAWLHQHLADGELHGAADILRMTLLAEEGGIYVDCDIFPPSDAQHLIDWPRILPMKNLVLMADGGLAVDLDPLAGVSSLGLTHALVMAVPRHPVITAMVAGLGMAHEAAARGAGGSAAAPHQVGARLLGRVARGPMTIVPAHTWQRYHLYDGGSFGPLR